MESQLPPALRHFTSNPPALSVFPSVCISLCACEHPHLCFFVLFLPSLFSLPLSLADGVIESKTLDGLTCADPAVFVSKFHRQPVYRGLQYETEDRGEQYRAAQ